MTSKEISVDIDIKIGLIAGAFDIIHPGYIEALERAKDECTFLVVALHEDPSIERPEKEKPIFSVAERIKTLETIQFVNWVIPYRTENDLIEILKVLRPRVRFLGEDYKDRPDKITGFELSDKHIYLPRDHGWSETKVKKLLRGEK